MRLADAQLVANMAKERERLIGLRDKGVLSVTISLGDRADTIDPVTAKQFRPIVNAAIDTRIAVLDEDLAGLGVEVAAEVA